MTTQGRESRLRRLIAVGALSLMTALLMGGCATPGLRSEFEAAPIYSHDTTVRGIDRTRILGPLFENQLSPDDLSFKAFRPFTSTFYYDDKDWEVTDYLWPLGMNKEYRGEREWRALLAFGHNFDVSDPRSPYRTTVFPFVYFGRSHDLNRYFAIFPLGGKIDRFLGRDEVWFVLFPLYARSRVKSQRTTSILWPIYSRTEGKRVSRWRVFPFYGESALKGRWKKRFVLWPFWTTARFEYPGHEGSSWILFPITGHTKTTIEDTWYFIPPLFRWSRGEKQNMINGPYPFFQQASGAKEKLYFWPIWGRKVDGPVTSHFYLWPLGATDDIDRVTHRVQGSRLFPLYYHRRKSRPLEPPDASAELSTEEAAEAHGEVFARYLNVWPLFNYRRDDTASKFRLLSLWPGRELGGIERNYAGIWSLYRRERTESEKEHDLLWGLARTRSNTEGDSSFSVFPLVAHRREISQRDARSWSLLMGLIGRDRVEDRCAWRLLYVLKFGSTEATEQEADHLSETETP